MAANYCPKCQISWPENPKSFIGWRTRRDYSRKCASCLGPLDPLPYREAIAQDKAISVAGWAEFVRREIRREKKRVQAGEPSPEELGRRDAEVQFKAQEALRRDLEKIKKLPEGEPGFLWLKRKRRHRPLDPV